MDSPFIIDEISTDFRRGISMSNRWWIDKDISIEIELLTFVDYDDMFMIAEVGYQGRISDEILHLI